MNLQTAIDITTKKPGKRAHFFEQCGNIVEIFVDTQGRAEVIRIRNQVALTPIKQGFFTVAAFEERVLESGIRLTGECTNTRGRLPTNWRGFRPHSIAS